MSDDRNIRAAERQHDLSAEFDKRLTEAATRDAQESIKLIFLINSGAAVAMLAFGLPLESGDPDPSCCLARCRRRGGELTLCEDPRPGAPAAHIAPTPAREPPAPPVGANCQQGTSSGALELEHRLRLGATPPREGKERHRIWGDVPGTAPRSGLGPARPSQSHSPPRFERQPPSAVPDFRRSPLPGL
jgi:hypothetical protein